MNQLDAVEEANPIYIPIVFAVDVLSLVIGLFVFAPASMRVSDLTLGLVSFDLQLSWLALLVTLPIIIWGAKLRFKDIGLISAKLPQGILVTVALWIALNVILTIIALAQGKPVELASAWRTTESSLRSIGFAFSMFVGVALLEEIVFRGFMIPQIRFWLKRFERLNPKSVTFLALLISNLFFFTPMHLPTYVWQSLSTEIIVMRFITAFIGGMILAWVYVKTDNLFIAIGSHGLVNATPMAIVEPYFDSSGTVLLLTILVAIVWPKSPRTETDQPAYVGMGS